ncbi:MAG: hypothetical protein WAS33_22210, partial [Candidatus Promineifilaceae bacterium]
MERFSEKVFFKLTLILMIPIALIMAFTVNATTTQNSLKISGVMPSFTDLRTNTFQISPDGRYVIYVADQASDENYQLWSVPIDGSTSPIALYSENLYFSVPPIISPDGSRVVFVSEDKILYS